MRSCSDAAKKLSGSRNKSDMVRSTIELTSTTVQSAEGKDFMRSFSDAAKQLSGSRNKSDDRAKVKQSAEGKDFCAKVLRAAVAAERKPQ
jgi:hypothetical protein